MERDGGPLSQPPTLRIFLLLTIYHVASEKSLCLKIVQVPYKSLKVIFKL